MKLVIRVLISGFLASILLLATNTGLYGQDIHHSQFYTSPLNVNPALTGVFNGDTRLTANYRQQWFKNDLSRYMTGTISLDHRFLPKRWDRLGSFSAGLMINYDQAGDSKLSLGNLSLGLAYAIPLNLQNVISIGGLLGVSHRRYSQDDLTWDAQWTGDVFDPSRSSDEVFSSTSKTFFDAGAGINYRWQKSRRTKVDLGGSLYHINQPEQKFFDHSPSEKLPMRININLTPQFKIARAIDILLHGQYQNQKPYEEIVAGGYGKLHLSQTRSKRLALLLGAAVRLDDAIIPKVALEWNNWYAGFSYDINTSPFKTATVRRGGPEFSLMYVHTKARPIHLRPCPIF